MASDSPLNKGLKRAGGARSDNDRAVARELRRQLKRAARRKGEPRPVQVAGKPLEAEDYAKWRRRALRRGSLSRAPELQPGRYALVLLAFDPAGTGGFIRSGAANHVVPPTVGTFQPKVEPAVALAGTLAGWLELYTDPVALAPPLLHTGGRWRVADLGLDWPLRPHGSDAD